MSTPRRENGARKAGREDFVGEGAGSSVVGSDVVSMGTGVVATVVGGMVVTVTEGVDVVTVGVGLVVMLTPGSVTSLYSGRKLENSTQHRSWWSCPDPLAGRMPLSEPEHCSYRCQQNYCPRHM